MRLEYKDHGYIYSHTKCVDTQPDCVDTTGFNYSDCFLGQSSSVDTQVDYVDTTGGCNNRNLSTNTVDSSTLVDRTGATGGTGTTGGTSSPNGGASGADTTSSCTSGTIPTG
ncbi:hypothetical protein Taro_050398 [Colocasia esculenta]|uniref:Uncharacterized protein n=1 Tax=Colocasia esculenta TaxID=4460 RepID=A0A843XDB9_COLES|nr:hypothetical protein [Colocasia esculenta]